MFISVRSARRTLACEGMHTEKEKVAKHRYNIKYRIQILKRKIAFIYVYQHGLLLMNTGMRAGMHRKTWVPSGIYINTIKATVSTIAP